MLTHKLANVSTPGHVLVPHFVPGMDAIVIPCALKLAAISCSGRGGGCPRVYHELLDQHIEVSFLVHAGNEGNIDQIHHDYIIKHEFLRVS